MSGYKSSLRTLKTKKQERRRYPDGTTAVLEFTLDEQPVSEVYQAKDHALLYQVHWEKGFRGESYSCPEGILNRGEYEAARIKFPGMPASQGYDDIADPRVSGSSVDSRGYRRFSFKWAPGHFEHRTYDHEGRLVDGQNIMRLPDGTSILEHLGRDGALHQRSVEAMAPDRTGFYYKRVYLGNAFRETHGEHAEGVPQDLESYQVDRRPATRAEYEAERHRCPVMPAADFAVRDLQAEVNAREAYKAYASGAPTLPRDSP